MSGAHCRRAPVPSDCPLNQQSCLNFNQLKTRSAEKHR